MLAAVRGWSCGGGGVPGVGEIQHIQPSILSRRQHTTKMMFLHKNIIIFLTTGHSIQQFNKQTEFSFENDSLNIKIK